MLYILYKQNDISPFLVYIEKIEPDEENTTQKKYNYMKIAKEFFQLIEKGYKLYIPFNGYNQKSRSRA